MFLKAIKRLFVIGTAISAVLLLGWGWYIDREVRSAFEGRKWQLPAKVFARPMELFNGQLMSEPVFAIEMQGAGYEKVERLARPGQWQSRGSRISLWGREVVVNGEGNTTPKVEFTIDAQRIANMRIDGQLSNQVVQLEPPLIGGIYPRLKEDRELVRLQQIPPLLGEALIAVEDKNFVDHFGVSWRGIVRAAWVNLRSGRVVQGGSTLTQQLAKNFFLSNERSVQRKVKELLMSLVLELHYDKAEILETYVNEVYLGQNGSHQIHGFGLASKHYFHKPVSQLQTHEIALLVGLVKGASYYNPWRHPQRALQRRDLVLDVLSENKLIGADEWARAKSLPLDIVTSGTRGVQKFPAFMDLVKYQLRKDYSDDALKSEGLRVYTSLSYSAQMLTERAIADQHERLDRRYRVASELQSAGVLVEVGSGEVAALVGGRNPRYPGFNRAVNAQRSVGSLIKPALYLSALMSSGGMHLASIISDAPIKIKEPNGEIWQPRNFDRKSHGDVLLIDALSNSYNQAATRLGMELGLHRVAELLAQLGLEKPAPQHPAMLLGAIELSPLQIASIYHTLANDGVMTPLRTIRSVEDVVGDQLQRYPLKVVPINEPDAVALLQFALQTAVREGTGKALYRSIDESLITAGKTGTSDAQRDSWFAGFTGQHLGIFWMGFDDNQPTPITGATGAMGAWASLLSALPTRSLDINPHSAVEYYWVDGETGLLSGENCRRARLVPFLRGTMPPVSTKCDHVINPVVHWFRKLFSVN